MHSVKVAIKAVIFDFDGVLLDSEPIHYQATADSLSERGIHLSRDEYFAQYIGLSDSELFPLILKRKSEKNHSKAEIQFLIEEKIRRYLSLLRNGSDLSPKGMLDIVYLAHRSVGKLGICSGSTRKEVEAGLLSIDRGALASLFKVIISKEDVHAGKPSPEGYLKAAKQLGVEANNCLVIEDTRSGIRAGNQAGMVVAAVATNQPASALISAHYVAENSTKLQAWIADLFCNK